VSGYRLSVRTMFSLYVLLTLTGLVVYVAVGLAHR
jgi:hypothetical protein